MTYMVKESHIKILLTTRNKKKYNKIGYVADIGDFVYVEISDIPKMSHIKITAICEICNIHNTIQYSKYNKNIERGGYYSCKKCSGVKRKKTIKEKYGVDCIFQREDVRNIASQWMKSDEFKITSKETIKNKWGFDSYSKTDEFKERISKANKNNKNAIKKREKTCLENYGYKSILEIPGLKEKSMYDKYGATYSYNIKSIRDKIIKTNMEKFNCASPFGDSKIQEKSKLTNIEKYGYPNVFSSPLIKNQIKKTLLDKYNCTNPMQHPGIFSKSMSNYSRKFKIEKIGDLNYQSLYELDFILFCEKNSIQIENGPVINYEQKRYFSDFIIPKYNLICEIKSQYTFDMDKDKNLLKEKECLKQGYNFLFIIDKNYNDIFKYLNSFQLYG